MVTKSLVKQPDNLSRSFAGSTVQMGAIAPSTHLQAPGSRLFASLYARADVLVPLNDELKSPQNLSGNFLVKFHSYMAYSWEH